MIQPHFRVYRKPKIEFTCPFLIETFGITGVMFVKYVVCVCSILLHSIPHVRVTLYTLLTLTLLVKIVRGVVFNIFLLSTISGDVVSSNGRWTAAISLRLRRGFWTFFCLLNIFLIVGWLVCFRVSNPHSRARSFTLSLSSFAVIVSNCSAVLHFGALGEYFYEALRFGICYVLWLFTY